MLWLEAPFTVMRNASIISCVKESWSAETDSRIKATVAVAGTPLLFGL